MVSQGKKLGLWSWKSEVRWLSRKLHPYFRSLWLHQISLGVHPYPSATPPHTHAIFCLSRLYWLASIPRIKNGPRILWKLDTNLQSTKVSWQFVWKGDWILTVLLKSLSNFQMFTTKNPWVSSMEEVMVWVTLRQCLLGKNHCRAFTTTPCLTPILPITNEAGIPFWQVARGGCSVVRGRPSRKRGKQTNEDPLYFPSPFKPASGAVVVFLLFCLILSLSSLRTIEATMVLSKWFHRLLFRHSTFNISILSFCFHTKGALLQYNVLRIMSMSSNSF